MDKFALLTDQIKPLAGRRNTGKDFPRALPIN
jgi:hypothetical protein